MKKGKVEANLMIQTRQKYSVCIFAKVQSRSVFLFTQLFLWILFFNLLLVLYTTRLAWNLDGGARSKGYIHTY